MPKLNFLSFCFFLTCIMSVCGLGHFSHYHALSSKIFSKEQKKYIVLEDKSIYRFIMHFTHTRLWWEAKVLHFLKRQVHSCPVSYRTLKINFRDYYKLVLFFQQFRQILSGILNKIVDVSIIVISYLKKILKIFSIYPHWLQSLHE